MQEICEEGGWEREKEVGHWLGVTFVKDYIYLFQRLLALRKKSDI